MIVFQNLDITLASLIWRRRLHINEVVDLNVLLFQIPDVMLIGAPDLLIWKFGIKICFVSTFKTYFKIRNLVATLGDFHFRPVWKIHVPPKIQFFTWLSLHGIFPSKDNHFKRAIIAMESTSCSFCNELEIQDHILCHCSFTGQVWTSVLKVFRL